jgi:hypothetical protein
MAHVQKYSLIASFYQSKVTDKIEFFPGQFSLGNLLIMNQSWLTPHRVLQQLSLRSHSTSSSTLPELISVA